MDWYTIVHCGSDPQPAKGPFRTVGEAEEAMQRFRGRHGYLAGTFLAAGATHIAGPFRTRQQARGADISTS